MAPFRQPFSCHGPHPSIHPSIFGDPKAGTPAGGPRIPEARGGSIAEGRPLRVTSRLFFCTRSRVWGCLLHFDVPRNSLPLGWGLPGRLPTTQEGGRDSRDPKKKYRKHSQIVSTDTPASSTGERGGPPNFKRSLVTKRPPGAPADGRTRLEPLGSGIKSA